MSDTNKQLREELEVKMYQLISEFDNSPIDKSGHHNPVHLRKELLKLFKSHSLKLLERVETEVIGEDTEWEDGMTDQAWYEIRDHNEDLAEQRQKLNKIKGEL